MPAHVISKVETLNESAAAEYRERAARSIEAHGGRYLVRGAAPVVVEGRRPMGESWWWSFRRCSGYTNGIRRQPMPRR